MDYSHLPESLRYIKRKQGALKWRNPSRATSRLSKLLINRNFWKNMIYQMPSVPMGKLRTATWAAAEADRFVIRQTAPEETRTRTEQLGEDPLPRRRFILTLLVRVLMSSMLPPTGETGIMKYVLPVFGCQTQAVSHWNAKCCVSFRYVVYFSMWGLPLFDCIYFCRYLFFEKKSVRCFFSPVVYVIAGRTENMPWPLHY